MNIEIGGFELKVKKPHFDDLKDDFNFVFNDISHLSFLSYG